MKKTVSFTKDEKYFLLRRLHSLAGIFPIGVFFLEHIYSNAISLQGPKAFNDLVAGLMKVPYLIWIEVLLIALPILFHIVLGIGIYLTSKSNTLQYRYFNNWRYYLQRLTGLIGVVYIGYHVWMTRIKALISGQHVTYDQMQQMLSTPWVFWFYVVGVISLTFHFANGIWTFLITWGVTINPRSQQISSFACMGAFIVMSVIWMQILFHFVGWV
jgi:succinate dehydrogenase / fumarate reductase cytochrome b subunit